MADIAAWQKALWQIVPIGSYRYGNVIRQVPNNAVIAETQPLRFKLKPAPGQTEVVLYLTAREFAPAHDGALMLWHRPRFEGGNKPPLLLRDVAQVAEQFAVDYRVLFADTPRYLAAAVDAANNRKVSVTEVAARHAVDAVLLQRWIDLLGVEPLVKDQPGAREFWSREPAIALQLLSRKSPPAANKPKITGWRDDNADLPVVVANASDQVVNIPGTVRPHQVVVHPTPTQFSAIVWTSPLAGTVRVSARVAHAHPACGNGISWWLEQRRGERSAILDGGNIDLGKKAEAKPRELKVAMGDALVLAIGARNLDHSCDLTAADLTITEIGKEGRVWDLARDVADSIQEGNPHADKHGNKDVWRFAKGADPTTRGKPVVGNPNTPGAKVPPGSILAQRRKSAADPQAQAQLGKLAEQVRDVLTGARPTQDKDPDRLLYDNLVTLDGPLFQGIDVARLMRALRKEKDQDKAETMPPRYGLLAGVLRAASPGQARRGSQPGGAGDIGAGSALARGPVPGSGVRRRCQN